MKWALIIVSLFFLPLIFADDCDFEVSVISENIFTNKSDFEFRYFINKIEGGRANITLNKSIEDAHGNVVKSYGLGIEENVLNRRTHPSTPLSPNLDEGVYLIKGEIFPNCNDTHLENNFDSKLIIILPEEISKDYSNLKITEFLPDPKGKDDAETPGGEWIELYNYGNTPLDLENLSLYDYIGKEPDLFITDTNTLNGTIIGANDYLIVYMKGIKGFLSNEGFEKISLFYENILLDEISYSNTKEGLSWSKVNNKWILTIPSPDEENNIEEPDYASSLKIETVYYGNDDYAKFGDSLRVRINVYKGDTTKYNLDLYLVDENDNQVSKRSEINFEEKFINYTLIVPIQIDPNCKGKYANGTYTLVLKGLDEKTEKEIDLKGINKELCEVIKIKEEIASSAVNSPLENKESEIANSSLTSSVVYQSSDLKTKSMGIYFFCGVLLLLIIYLIFKKTL